MLARATDEELREILTHPAPGLQDLGERRADVGRRGIENKMVREFSTELAYPINQWRGFRVAGVRERFGLGEQGYGRRRVKKLFQFELPAGMDEGRDLTARGLQRLRDAGQRARFAAAPHRAAADHGKFPVRFAKREKVARVSEIIRAGCEVRCSRSDLQLETDAFLRRLIARLKLHHLPRCRSRSTVAVRGFVRDVNGDHG